METEIVDINFLDYGQEEIYNALLVSIYEKIDNNYEFKNFKDKKMTKPSVVFNSKMKKTIWENFVTNCNEIERENNHLKLFIEKELTTTTSIKESGQLIIKGKYEFDIIMKQYAKYLKYYVQCGSCKSFSTKFGNSFVVCRKCFSERMVK